MMHEMDQDEIFGGWFNLSKDNTFFKGIKILELQLNINGFLIADGINTTLNMGNIVILKTA